MSSAHAGNAYTNRVSLSSDASGPAHEPRGNAPRRARQVAVPAVARARCTLRRVDYEDAFAVELGSAYVRTAEQWARAFLEDAPLAMRDGLRRGWLALGLKLDAVPPERSVLGWEVRHSNRDYVLLGADSRIGMPAELLVARQKIQERGEHGCAPTARETIAHADGARPALTTPLQSAEVPTASRRATAVERR